MFCESRPDPHNLAYARSILQEAYRQCLVLSPQRHWFGNHSAWRLCFPYFIWSFEFGSKQAVEFGSKQMVCFSSPRTHASEVSFMMTLVELDVRAWAAPLVESWKSQVEKCMILIIIITIIYIDWIKLIVSYIIYIIYHIIYNIYHISIKILLDKTWLHNTKTQTNWLILIIVIIVNNTTN